MVLDLHILLKLIVLHERRRIQNKLVEFALYRHTLFRRILSEFSKPDIFQFIHLPCASTRGIGYTGGSGNGTAAGGSNTPCLIALSEKILLCFPFLDQLCWAQFCISLMLGPRALVRRRQLKMISVKL